MRERAAWIATKWNCPPRIPESRLSAALGSSSFSGRAPWATTQFYVSAERPVRRILAIRADVGSAPARPGKKDLHTAIADGELRR